MNFLSEVTNAQVYIPLPSSPILHLGIGARFKPPLINILELESSQPTKKHPPCNSFLSFRWMFLWPFFLAELQWISSVSVDCLAAAVGCFHRRRHNAGELPIYIWGYAEVINHISDNPMLFRICAILTQIGNRWVYNITKINRFQFPFWSQIFPLFH